MGYVNFAVTKGSQTMAKKLLHGFSFSDDDLQTFVQQYKATTVAKEMFHTQHSVDERLAVSIRVLGALTSFPKGLRQPYREYGQNTLRWF